MNSLFEQAAAHLAVQSKENVPSTLEYDKIAPQARVAMNSARSWTVSLSA